MFEEISNGKQFWCSRKPAGRLVGQPSRWCQGDSPSWAAAVLPGKDGHFLLCTNHRSASTTQAPSIFASNKEFILETGLGTWEMKAAEGTIHSSTSAIHRGAGQGGKSFLVKQNKTSSTTSMRQKFQMVNLYLFLGIGIQLKKVKDLIPM